MLEDIGSTKFELIQKVDISLWESEFQEELFQMTDNQGTFYVMHAPEAGDYCYANILGHHFGQGDRQYIFADETSPAE